MGGSEFAKAANRFLVLRRLAVGAVLDGLIVWAFLTLTRAEYQEPIGLADVAIGLVVLWAMEILVGTKSALFGMISAAFFERRPLVANFLQILRNTKVRPPGRNYAAEFDYLREMIDDGHQDPEDRIKAAAVYGTWNGVMTAKGLVARFALTQAWDDAVRQYQDENRARSSRQEYDKDLEDGVTW